MNYPPGSQPPPLSPPPGAPGAPQPYYYPPPPPPKKSGAMKWILIGCGGITLLGLLCCGGFVGLGFWGYYKFKQELVAQFTPMLNANETVRAELGEVKSIDTEISKWKKETVDGKEVTYIPITVVGEKGSGTIDVEMRQAENDKVLVTAMLKKKDGTTVLLGHWKSTQGGKWEKVDSAEAPDGK